MKIHNPNQARFGTVHGLVVATLLLGGLFCLLMSGSADSSSGNPFHDPLAITKVSVDSVGDSSRYQTTVQPIQTVRVGQRVWLEDNPSGESDDRFGDQVVPADWRKMVLRSPKTSGDHARVEMLRPLWWLEQRNVRAGGQVDIEVPECGIKGKLRWGQTCFSVFNRRVGSKKSAD